MDHREGRDQTSPTVGKEDKREVTVLVTVSANGDLLPPQVIYQGKTSGCHAKVTFPEDWAIAESESHWTTEATLVHYVDNECNPAESSFG